MTTRTFREVLNGAGPDGAATMLRSLGLGNLIASMPAAVRHANPAADVSQLATLESIALPKAQRASLITRAYARAGGVTAGALTIVAANTTPATGEVGIAPNGDVVVLAADAWTDIDVEFNPTIGEVVDLTDCIVASSAFAIPAIYTARGVVYLLAVTATTGTVTGTKIITAPAAAVAAATHARLDLAKANVKFAAADAVTKANISILVASSTPVVTALAADATNFIG